MSFLSGKQSQLADPELRNYSSFCSFQKSMPIQKQGYNVPIVLRFVVYFRKWPYKTMGIYVRVCSISSNAFYFEIAIRYVISSFLQKISIYIETEIIFPFSPWISHHLLLIQFSSRSGGQPEPPDRDSPRRHGIPEERQRPPVSPPDESDT